MMTLWMIMTVMHGSGWGALHFLNFTLYYYILILYLYHIILTLEILLKHSCEKNFNNSSYINLANSIRIFNKGNLLEFKVLFLRNICEGSLKKNGFEFIL